LSTKKEILLTNLILSAIENLNFKAEVLDRLNRNYIRNENHEGSRTAK